MKRIQIFSFITFLFMTSCQKGYLDVKPDKKLSIPSTLEDLDLMLNHRIFYVSASNILGVASTDDFYVKDQDFAAITSSTARNTYLFSSEIFEGDESGDWNQAYQRILYANVILASIDTINVTSANKSKYNEIKGSALFHRAANHYQLAQLFCHEYKKESANQTYCIPIRKDYDVTNKGVQGTLQDVYEFMISDLSLALELLPDFKTIYRPSKPAAHLLLARIYLHMEDYHNSRYHSGLGLSYKSDLANIGLLDSNAEYIFPINLEQHPEIILNHEGQASPATMTISRINVSKDLLDLYEEGDLRKTMYFRKHSNGNIVFRGCYRPSNTIWGGYSTNELWLIKAESSIRLNDRESALNDLNHFLSVRYKPGSFNPLNTLDNKQILKRILEERRKDLLFTGARWEDLKRLNKEEEYSKSLERVVNGQKYTLTINSPKWVFPFPKNELDINGWHQYPRF